MSLLSINVETCLGHKSVLLGGYLQDVAQIDGSDLITTRSISDLPEQVDLRAWCSPVENQGTLGSCTANAAVGALEYLRSRRNYDPCDYSRLFVYFNTRRLRGDTENDTGAMIAECMAALLAYGAPPEELWPYSDSDRWTEQPADTIYQQAKIDMTLQYSQLRSDASILSALAQGFPVCFGIFLPEKAYASASQSGQIAQLRAGDWQAHTIGGHAMLLVGYDLLRSHYIVRNSWGTDYGDQGYLYIPFDLMQRAGHPDSFWVVGELEEHGRLGAASERKFLDVDGIRDSIKQDLDAELTNLKQGLRGRLRKKD